MKLNLDDWQKKFIACKGDKELCCGRKVGKTEITAKDTGEFAAHHVKLPQNKWEDILVIAPVERQAYLIFEQTCLYMLEEYPELIDKSTQNKPTKTRLCLKNGVRIWCLPVGISGLGIRGLTIVKLVADEAAFIPDDVWTAVTPMLMIAGGCKPSKTYLGTPAGDTGMFYDVWVNTNGAYDSFTRFSITSEECILNRKISNTWSEQQRQYALDYLKEEKLRMTKAQYAQEYEGKFVSSLRQFFSTDLIKERMTLNKHDPPKRNKAFKAALGSDIAREGGDETAHIGLEMNEHKHLWQIEQDKMTFIRLTEIARDILARDEKNSYNRLYLDDGGLGAGVLDILLESKVRRKVRGINNGTWICSFDKKEKKLMKEHLYNNILKLMEDKKIDLFKDNDLYMSLKSIQAEYKDGKTYIYGKYSHLTEALVRAAWISKEKGLNLWIA